MGKTYKVRPRTRRATNRHRWLRVQCPECQAIYRAWCTPKGWGKLARRELALPRVTCQPCERARIWAAMHGGTVEEWRNPELAAY